MAAGLPLLSKRLPQLPFRKTLRARALRTHPFQVAPNLINSFTRGLLSVCQNHGLQFRENPQARLLRRNPSDRENRRLEPPSHLSRGFLLNRELSPQDPTRSPGIAKPRGDSIPVKGKQVMRDRSIKMPSENQSDGRFERTRSRHLCRHGGAILLRFSINPTKPSPDRCGFWARTRWISAA